MERRHFDPRPFAPSFAIRPRSQVALVDAEHRELHEPLTLLRLTRMTLEPIRPVAA
jgi:hypothetical protein